MLAYINWDMSPEIIEGFHIRWYGLLFALGFILGYNILARIVKKEGKPDKLMDGLLTYVMIGTILGARLGHCIFYQPEYYLLKHPLEIFMVWKGGLASHGGAAGILIAIWFFARSYKQSYLWVVDRLCIVIPLAAFLIRTGNFFNSEILGKPATVAWAVIFKHVDNIPRHPAQLYEAFCYLLIFVIMILGYHYAKFFKNKGFILGLFLTTIFGVRIFIETLKENQVGFEDNMALNMGQILSIPLVLTGIFLMVRSFKPKFRYVSS